MFEINNKEYTSYKICGSTIYEFKDFYKYPDQVVKLVNDIPAGWHKKEEMNNGISLNGKKFYDLRHHNQVNGIKEVTDFLSTICHQPVHFKDNTFATNIFQFIDPAFNKYKDNYWWPHIDSGYTALIYLNNFSYPGTNLYSALKEPDYDQNEHYKPWQPKSDWKIEATLEAKFNKLVMFDGLNNPHAMVINSDLFYNKTRLNQVVFFNS